MSEAFTPLTAPAAVVAAHRIYDRVDRALSIRRGLTGVPDSEIVSIVILARQLDAIARLAAEAETLVRPRIGSTPDEANYALGRLTAALVEAGYLPLPAPPAQEIDHGEG